MHILDYTIVSSLIPAAIMFPATNGASLILHFSISVAFAHSSSKPSTEMQN
jgi:hypothetical protein